MCKHTGQKPFKCDVEGCNKTYTTAANLRAHQKRHGNKALTGIGHVVVSLTCRGRKDTQNTTVTEHYSNGPFMQVGHVTRKWWLLIHLI